MTLLLVGIRYVELLFDGFHDYAVAINPHDVSTDHQLQRN